MKIQLLDCTLRDGGYVNNWHFGKRNIETVWRGLVESGIDIVECGYLVEGKEQDVDSTEYSSIGIVEETIGSLYVGKSDFAIMIDYGRYSIEKLPEYKGGAVRIIRLAFHKKDVTHALQAAMEIVRKGYSLFLQPMVTMSYSDEEFLELITGANEVMPDAFYIVDSFGVMKKSDLLRFFFMVQHNLNKNIRVGYHSHNNMQLAYSNAQAFVEETGDRAIIVDASMMGMGRGAGNLNTELFAEYLNNIGQKAYEIPPLLQIADRVLGAIYAKQYWGYSLAYYVSAVNQCHPNYASYLSKKNSLTIDEINTLLKAIPEEKRVEFDKELVEQIYTNHLSCEKAAESRKGEFVDAVRGRNVLVIAPGRSSFIEKEKIVTLAESEDCISISINHEYEHYATDYVFYSNIRRYKNSELTEGTKLIITSNVTEDDAYLKLDYRSLLNECDGVRDNAGMMLLQFLVKLPIKKIYLAGMDGYSMDVEQNYSSEKYELNSDKELLKKMNEGLNYLLQRYSKEMQIEFLTTPHFISVERA